MLYIFSRPRLAPRYLAYLEELSLINMQLTRLSFIGFIFVALFCSCRHGSNGNQTTIHKNLDKSRENIKNVFQPTYAIKQVTTKVSGNYYHYCDATLYLNSDSTFTYEQGCKGKPDFKFGKWRLVGDSVELDPFAEIKNHISYNVSFGESDRSTQVTFLLRDKTNTPIKDFVIQPFNQKPDFSFTGDGIQYIKTNNAIKVVPGQCSTNDAGIITLDKAKSDSLDFSKLYPLAGKKFTISTRNLPDTIKLVININAIALVNYRLKFLNDSKPFKFKYKGGKAVIDTTWLRR
jgi:hypothetical protein